MAKLLVPSFAGTSAYRLMISVALILFPLLLAGRISLVAAIESEETGARVDNVSVDNAPDHDERRRVDVQCPVGQCSAQSPNRRGRRHRTSTVYDGGGCAQAYKPHAPVKTEVCGAEEADSRRYRPASRPFWRSNRGGSAAPRVEVRGRLWSCVAGDAEGDGDCSARPLPPESVSGTIVEVWQARPDGTYSSIAPGREEGECRAALSSLLTSASETVEFRFDTVAPGSSGGLGGLGPSGFDLPPYGPPVVHLLIRAPGYESLLVDMEVSPGSTFRGGDWRGRGLVGVATGPSLGGDGLAVQYEVSTMEDGSMVVEADFFLATNSVEGGHGIKGDLCRSSRYGWRPRSFFTEPIALCAPSLLDYFDL